MILFIILVCCIVWMFTAAVFILSYIPLAIIHGNCRHAKKIILRSMASTPKEMYGFTRTCNFFSWFMFFIQILLYPHLYIWRFLYEISNEEEEIRDDLSD